MPELRKISGVLNFVFWLDKPFIVPDEEINTIREFLNEYKNVTLEKIDVDDKARFPTNLVSKIKDGRIYNRNNTARALLPTLGYLMVAEEREATIEMPVPHLLPRLRSIMDKIVG